MMIILLLLLLLFSLFSIPKSNSISEPKPRNPFTSGSNESSSTGRFQFSLGNINLQSILSQFSSFLKNSYSDYIREEAISAFAPLIHVSPQLIIPGLYELALSSIGAEKKFFFFFFFLLYIS
jgi:hypothetical protein